MGLFGLILSNIDASRGNRGDGRWFADRPVIKDRPMIQASDRKKKSVARRKNERAARRITRKAFLTDTDTNTQAGTTGTTAINPLIPADDPRRLDTTNQDRCRGRSESCRNQGRNGCRRREGRRRRRRFWRRQGAVRGRRCRQD
jgi:hypothetical protein